VLIATTPRTTPFMKKLVAMDGVSITSGWTYDNVAHLSPEFLKKIRGLYEGNPAWAPGIAGRVDPQPGECTIQGRLAHSRRRR
jgi:phage terminase large subunit-like protein